MYPKGLIVIYPDGEIESVEIDGTTKWHADIFKELLKISSKFREYCDKEDIDYYIYYRGLLKACSRGCILILNEDLEEIYDYMQDNKEIDIDFT